MFRFRKFSSLSISVVFAALPAFAAENAVRYREEARRFEAESPTRWERKLPMSPLTAGLCRWLSETLAKQAQQAEKAGR